MVAQNLLQGIVEQVSSGMVSGRSVTLVGINACHELGCGILWQLLYNVNALTVLTLGVDDVDGLGLVNEYTAITNLSTHLTIEWGVIEYQLVELVLFLSYLAVADDMALVFGIVVAYKGLLSSRTSLTSIASYFYPVAVLNGSGITGTVLLLLHLNIELLLVNGKTVFTTDELGEVERESVGVEQTEGLHAIQFGLTLSLEGVHSVVQHADTLFEGAEERLFLFLNHLGDKLLLGLQLGEGTAHLGNECWNKLVQETILLIQEGIGITYGTAQDTTDNITCLGIRRQLTVGD